MDNDSGVIGPVSFSSVLTESVTAAASTEAALFPPAAALEWQYPSRGWRSQTAGSQQTLVLDLGVPPDYMGVYLSRANFASATLQANMTDSWTTPALSLPLSLEFTPLLGRRQGLFFFNLNRQGVRFRFLRLVIPAQTPDGEEVNYFNLGAFLPVTLLAEVQFRGPLRLLRRQAVLDTSVAGGRRDVRYLAEPQLVLELPWTWAFDPSRGSVGHEQDIIEALPTGPNEPVVVNWNTRAPECAILARRQGDFALESESGIGANLALQYEEVI